MFGDGFETVVDPKDPNIVYSQWQYGGLVRFDKASGETDRHSSPSPERASRACVGTGIQR